MLAVVDSVDERNGTCDVSPINGGAQVFDVYLVTEMEVLKDPDYVQTTPKVGSIVVIDFYDDAHAVVACFGESQMWAAKHGKHQIAHSSEGLSVTRERDSLATAVGDLVKLNGDLLDLLTRFIVITPSGPSTAVDPATIVKLQQLKATSVQLQSHFKRLLK